MQFRTILGSFRARLGLGILLALVIVGLGTVMLQNNSKGNPNSGTATSSAVVTQNAGSGTTPGETSGAGTGGNPAGNETPAPATATASPTATPTPTPTPTPQVAAEKTSVNLYDKFEATFTISKTSATNFQFPYDPNPPSGIPAGDGITVDGLFSLDNWATVITQPAFIYQDYARTIIQNKEHITPVAQEVWKVRFAPTKVGTYRYKIRIEDAFGIRYLTDDGNGKALTFTALPAAGNDHGFIEVSKNDPRYFEFSDGTPFIGIGTNGSYTDPKSIVSNLSDYIDKFSQNSANFMRVWFTASSLYGSTWSPWNSHHLPYDGYIPATGLTYEDAYATSQFSYKLDTTNPCLFQGWFDNVSVTPGTTYHLMVRAKLVDLKGQGQSDYGFAVKSASWLDKQCSNSGNGTYLLNRVTSSNGWQEFEADFTTAPDQYFMEDLYLAAENISGGAVYIDEVSIRADAGNGQLGPEIINKGKAAQQFYFDDVAAKRWDMVIEKAEQAKVYLKPVILEKNDFVFGHLNPDGTLLASTIQQGSNTNFYGTADSEVRRLQEYYWRYLTARWGYSTAIQSWELLNEGDPFNGNHYAQAEAFSKYIKEIDPNQHLTTTSLWHSLPVSEFWGNSAYPDLSYVDAHSYSDDTSWLDVNDFKDPTTGINISDDSAIFSYAHSMDALQKFSNSPPKPVVLGEAGIVHNGVTLGKDDSDSKGVWLHQLLWGGTNPGAIQYTLYWYTESIKKYNLYPIFKVYAGFFGGQGAGSGATASQGQATASPNPTLSPGSTINRAIPVNNGHFQALALTLPANTLGWGQQDSVNGGAYFWLYDSRYNLTNPNGGDNLAGRSLTVTMAAQPQKPQTYTIEWWDTWTGQVLTESQTVTTGTIKLTVPAQFKEKDVAVKIYPAERGFTAAPGAPR